MAPIAVDDKLLQQITDTIVEHFHPRRIILFGSRARDEARPDSDIDLLVEMESDKSFYERGAEVDMLFANRRWSMDLIVLTPEELRKEEAFPGGVVRTAVREGKTLYAAQ
jgi:predicted nucleotidyltransferase